MTDIYIAAWGVPTGSVPWYTQEFNSKLQILEDVVAQAKSEIDGLHKDVYDGRWLFVAPEYTFMSFSHEERIQTDVTDLANLKTCCEGITGGEDGLLLVPGSIVYTKKLYQRLVHQTFVEHQPAYLKAIERLEKFYESRLGFARALVALGKKVGEDPTKRDVSTGRDKQVSRTLGDLKKLQLHQFNPKSSFGVNHQRNKVRLIANGYLVRNIAYGYYQGQKRFAFKKRTNIEVTEGFDSNLLFDVGTGDAVWNWDGLEVGLEICADAGTGLLQHNNKVVDIYIVIAESQDRGALNSPPFSCRVFVDSSREVDIEVSNDASMKTVPRQVQTDWGKLHIVKVQDL